MSNGHSRYHDKNAFCGTAGQEELQHLEDLVADLTDDELIDLVGRLGIELEENNEKLSRMDYEDVIHEALREDFYIEYRKILDLRNDNEGKALNSEEVQRIIDSFHMGRIYCFWKLDKNRYLVETTKGLFGLVSFDDLEAFPAYDDKKITEWVNDKFSSSNGELIRTSEEWPSNRDYKIPVVHKFDNYYCCLKL